ncbi:MAG: cupredoxin domain-containing protein [Actinobacteria bacterium]|nr:cupredoxin domain-containing protein [Actinomycetota bacterium]
MRPVLRDRLVMPVLLPIAIVVILALVLFGFSRILLAVTPEAATATAILVASGVLAAASFAAARAQVRLSTIAAMLGAVTGFAMLAGGIALAVAGGDDEGEGEEERPVVVLAAADIAFDQASLTVPAGQPFTLRFHNQDADIQHNVDIFDNEALTGEPVFGGEIVTGVTEIDYPVPALEAGPYFFRCVIHPPMTGEMEAVEGGGGPGGPGPGGGVTVVAQNIEFDTDTIDLPPGAPTTITFDNRDAGTQHNIAIYTDPELSQELFNGDLITGPETIEYAVPSLEPGEYFFECIVHPTMNGTVVVGEGPGAPPPEPTGST